MRHEVPHELSLELCKRALEKTVDSFQAFRARIAWSDETTGSLHFSAKGVNINGIVRVFPDRVRITVQLPFLLRIFRRQAVNYIDSSIRRHFELAAQGKL